MCQTFVAGQPCSHGMEMQTLTGELADLTGELVDLTGELADLTWYLHWARQRGGILWILSQLTLKQFSQVVSQFTSEEIRPQGVRG